ncbi:hypothetical protein R6Q59_011492 [Mikania micrantha]
MSKPSPNGFTSLLNSPPDSARAHYLSVTREADVVVLVDRKDIQPEVVVEGDDGDGGDAGDGGDDVGVVRDDVVAYKIGGDDVDVVYAVVADGGGGGEHELVVVVVDDGDEGDCGDGVVAVGGGGVLVQAS